MKKIFFSILGSFLIFAPAMSFDMQMLIKAVKTNDKVQKAIGAVAVAGGMVIVYQVYKAFQAKDQTIQAKQSKIDELTRLRESERIVAQSLEDSFEVIKSEALVDIRRAEAEVKRMSEEPERLKQDFQRLLREEKERLELQKQMQLAAAKSEAQEEAAAAADKKLQAQGQRFAREREALEKQHFLELQRVRTEKAQTAGSRDKALEARDRTAEQTRTRGRAGAHSEIDGK